MVLVKLMTVGAGAGPGRGSRTCHGDAMEWLIGSAEVDLSPAERAINQLLEDKDSVADKLKELQDEAAKQQ